MTSKGKIFEKYRISYAWKVITGKTNNCSLTELHCNNTGLTIETCNIKIYKATKLTK